jgi:hypothetical protein
MNRWAVVQVLATIVESIADRPAAAVAAPARTAHIIRAMRAAAHGKSGEKMLYADWALLSREQGGVV